MPSKACQNGKPNQRKQIGYLADTNINGLHYYFVWFLFFILGTFNNFGYVIVLAAAKSLADCFHQSGLIGVESWALIGTGFIVKCTNAFYLEFIPHRIRGHITGILFLIGYTLLTFSVYIDFWFAIISILCIGTAASLGESVMLGYCKLFPAKVSGAWSSGTGMAGLAGATLYLLLAEVLHFSNQSIFILMTPSSIIYMIAVELSWRSSLRKPWTAPNHKTYHQKQNKIQEPLLAVVTDSVNTKSASAKYMEEESLCARIHRCFMMCYYPNIMLFLVYVFEYIISVGMAQIANTNRSDREQDLDYVVLATCYQFGVFLSRSSVSFIELPYFGTMTFLQFVNMILWGIHCQTDLFQYEGIEYGLMVYVGLLGGAMYANCAYSLLSDVNVTDQDRELCMNFMALAANLGITISAIAEVVMDNTFFKQLVMESTANGVASSGCATI